VGANALIVRDPEHGELVAALEASLAAGAPAPESGAADLPTDDYTFRVIRQLERQATLNQAVTARLALQRAELTILSGAAETVRAGVPLGQVLQELLGRCLNAAGVSRGAVHLRQPDGRLALRAQIGYPEPAGALLGDFFGQAAWLRRALDEARAIALPDPRAHTPEVERLLATAGAASILIVPLSFADEQLGAVWLGSGLRQLNDDWLPFAGAIASQLAQAIMMSRAFSRVAEAEERYRGLVDNASEGIFQSLPDGRLVMANPAMARILGYDSPEELLRLAGSLPRDVHVDPLRRQELIARLEAAGSVSRFELRARHKDGRIVRLSLNARAVRDARGVTQRYEGMAEDVTELRRAEEEIQRHREARFQAEKFAAMGELLAGVAHELNNPLSVVVGQATLLARALGEGTGTARAAKVTQAAERCARIVRSFLALARHQSTEKIETRLNQVVAEAVELLGYALRVDGVEVLLDLAGDLPALWADPHQLHQVLVNLLTNAQQAMRGGPAPRRIAISTRHDRAASRVLLRVADTGPGIPPEVQARIFEPFFTTKPPGQGTGLGLSLCAGIVESHDGTIRVESRPGEGAVFEVELPVVTPRAAPPAPAAAAAPTPVRRSRILVVDDEPGVTEVLSELLARDGHEVETAPNGAVALSRLEAASYDLILSDIRMPELDGPGLYREAVRRHPGLSRRFVFLTGDTLSRDAAAFLDETGAPKVSKPLSLPEVQRAVREALQRG
jgi:two-component system NtrC family sensor kinase